MKITGAKLKEKRESLSLTISEVSLATKINPKVLNAMENGDTAHLPAKTFLRGFVRAYAGYLKMNVEETLALFSQELGEVAKEALEAAAAKKEAEAASNSSSVDVTGEGTNTFRMFVIGGILILIVMIIGVRSLIQKYEHERATEALSEIQSGKVLPLKEEAKTEEKTATPEAVGATPPEAAKVDAPALPAAKIDDKAAAEKAAAAQKAASEKAASEKAAADKMAAEKAVADKVAADKAAAEQKIADKKAAAEKAAADKKEAADKVAAEKKEAADKKAAEKKSAAEKKLADKKEAEEKAAAEKAAKKEAAAKATADKEAAKVPEKKDEAPKAGRHEVILEALDRVDVKFELKGQTKKISLAPNQVHTIVTDGPITLDVSDGGAINITDNGRDKGPPGDLGHPKQVKLP
jgi:cytoskeletal protein RodZ